MARNKKIKHPKLPNGFGSIKKLSGNRSNPYGVYPPTKEFDNTGSPKSQSALCYVPDWYTGFHALMEYHNGTFDPESFSSHKIKDDDKTDVVIQKIISSFNGKNRLNENKKTYADIYQEYYSYKFERDKTREYSKSSIYAAQAGFKNSSALHNKVFRDLRTDDLQKVIDDCPLKHASKELILNLFKGMYDYADANDLCDKKYSDYVKINTPDDDEPGVPFTAEELKTIWEHVDDNTIIKGIIIMIYSGYRILAYHSLEVNTKEKYFKGGVKTRSGKKRIVPFCDIITPYIDTSIELFNVGDYQFRKAFSEELAKIGIHGHTPHDCRHTFSWLCDVFKVDELSKRVMMGHSLGKDVTDLKYGHRTLEELREEINKLKKDIDFVANVSLTDEN